MKKQQWYIIILHYIWYKIIPRYMKIIAVWFACGWCIGHVAQWAGVNPDSLALTVILFLILTIKIQQ